MSAKDTHFILNKITLPSGPAAPVEDPSLAQTSKMHSANPTTSQSTDTPRRFLVP